jgi:hypothetical protein
MTSELDELLRPTVAPPAPRGPLPWRVSSQFWVAFIGGAPAVTAIAFLNAGRLGASASKRRWILIAGGAAFLLSIALMGWLGTMEEHRRTARIGVRVIAVLLYLVLARIQRDDDGRHQVFGSGEYASLWIPGIVATLVSVLALLGLALLALPFVT